MIGLGLVLVVGLFAYFGGTPPVAGSDEGRQWVVATVGEQQVYGNQIDENFERYTAYFQQSEASLTPQLTARTLAISLNALVEQALIAELARRKGVTLTDDDLIQAAQTQIEQQIAQARFELMSSGKIKSGATEEEVSAAFRQAHGVDIATARHQLLDRFKESLKDPAKRGELVSQQVLPKLQEAEAVKIQLSDEQLKKGFDTWVTKRVAFNPREHQGEDLFAEAERVLKEIKGGLSFETAMNKYSDDPAMKGKKKSDSTVDITRATVEYDDAYKPLLNMKAGDISPVIPLATGPAIFKIVKIQPKVPADYNPKKEDYRKTRINEMASKRLFNERKALKDSGIVKWKSEGYRVLDEWGKLGENPENARDKTKMRSALQKVVAEAKKVTEEGGDIAGPKPAVLAYFAAFDEMYELSSKVLKSQLAAQRIDVLTALLEVTEGADLRLELTRLHLEQKKTLEAFDSLLTAAQSNHGVDEKGIERYKSIEALGKRMATGKLITAVQANQLEEEQKHWREEAFEMLKGQAETNEDYTESGQRQYNEINSRVGRLQRLNSLTDDQVKQIETAQKKWREEKAKFDKEQEELRKKEEAERKKAEAEKKKQEEAAKKAGTKPSTAKPPATTGGGIAPFMPSTSGSP